MIAVEVAPGVGVVELPVSFNGEPATLKFVATHAIELQAALSAAGEGRDG